MTADISVLPGIGCLLFDQPRQVCYELGTPSPALRHLNRAQQRTNRSSIPARYEMSIVRIVGPKLFIEPGPKCILPAFAA